MLLKVAQVPYVQFYNEHMFNDVVHTVCSNILFRQNKTQPKPVFWNLRSSVKKVCLKRQISAIELHRRFTLTRANTRAWQHNTHVNIHLHQCRVHDCTYSTQTTEWNRLQTVVGRSSSDNVSRVESLQIQRLSFLFRKWNIEGTTSNLMSCTSGTGKYSGWWMSAEGWCKRASCAKLRQHQPIRERISAGCNLQNKKTLVMLGYSSVCLFCLFIGLSAGLHTNYNISLKLRGGLVSAQNRTQYLLFISVQRIYLIYNFTVSLSGYTEIHLQEVYT